MEPLTHTPAVSRAEVLRGKGCNRGTQCVRDKPDDGVDTASESPRCNGIAAKRIDRALQNDVGNGVSR